MKYFTKKLRANRLAKKIVIIMYARMDRYNWDSPRYSEKFNYKNISIEIVPNDYYDGSDPPDVFVHYMGELVLEARAKGYGGGIGGYRIKAFREGQWIDEIEKLYKEADAKFVAHHQSEKIQREKNFSPIGK